MSLDGTLGNPDRFDEDGVVPHWICSTRLPAQRTMANCHPMAYIVLRSRD